MIDPVTLFALANGAVSAVKAGCKLYKDIKGAAGDVKEVIRDLDAQFHEKHPPSNPPTPQAKAQYTQERNRVIELNKQAGDTSGIYQQIGEHLGTYYDNYYKCLAVLEEQERVSRTEVYVGESSLAKRALQRVLMRKQLEQMGKDLRELMVYQCPPELGALWTEVNDMMLQMGKEQKVVVARQMAQYRLQEARQAAKRKKLIREITLGISTLVVIMSFAFCMLLVAYDRQEKYPEYGYGLIPNINIRGKYQ